MSNEQLKAWCVHAFTASGVICALFALFAVINKQPMECFMWLGAALFVDGIDGTFARRYEVKKHIPHFDGLILDLIIDYLNYVFIAALFIYYFIELPPYTKTFSVIIILLSSFFCFCNTKMKSDDCYFVGFPATWNIVALYLLVSAPAPIISFLVIIFLAILSVIPVKFLHPFRVRKAMPINIICTIIWVVMSGCLIAQYDHYQTWTLILWWLSGIYFIAFGIWQSIVDYKKNNG